MLSAKNLTKDQVSEFTGLSVETINQFVVNMEVP